MVALRKASLKTKEDECKDSSTLKQKTVNKIIESVRGVKVKTSNIIKSTNILKARAGGGQELERLDGDKEVESVMITATPPRKDVKSRKRKREVEGWGSPSADAVSEKNLRETPPWFWHDGRQQRTRVATNQGNCSKMKERWRFPPTRQRKKTSSLRGRR